MSLRDKINKQSVLLDKEKDRAESLKKSLISLKKRLAKKEAEIERLKDVSLKYDEMKILYEEIKSKHKDLTDYHSYYEHFSYVCNLCHKINVVSTYNNRTTYKFNCKYCGDINQFNFNFDCIYFLSSNHSNLIKIGYSSYNPVSQLSEINSKKDTIPWKLSAYHKTFSGKETESAIYRTLKKVKVGDKKLFDISLYEAKNTLFKEHGLKIIRLNED